MNKACNTILIKSLKLRVCVEKNSHFHTNVSLGKHSTRKMLFAQCIFIKFRNEQNNELLTQDHTAGEYRKIFETRSLITSSLVYFGF